MKNVINKTSSNKIGNKSSIFNFFKNLCGLCFDRSEIIAHKIVLFVCKINIYTDFKKRYELKFFITVSYLEFFFKTVLQSLLQTNFSSVMKTYFTIYLEPAILSQGSSIDKYHF